MQEQLVSALRLQRPHIRARWEALLRAQPRHAPLGPPEAMVHLLDWTLDELLATLANPLSLHVTGRPRSAVVAPPVCECGRNPLLGYFETGEQAIREVWEVAQSAYLPLDSAQRLHGWDLIQEAFRHIAFREIEAFCGVCQYRDAAPPAEEEAPNRPAEAPLTHPPGANGAEYPRPRH